MWDTKYAGKIALFDDYNTEIMIAAMYLGEDPYNPDLEKVKTVLQELKANTRTYWASYDDFIKPYTAGEIVMGNMWTGIASQLKSAGQPVAYVYPEEGTVGWTDFWAIAKDAPNYDLACKWVEFMTDTEFQTAFATDANAHCPVNEAVLNSLTDEQKQILWIYPEAPTNIVLQAYQDDASRQAWLDLWNEVKAG
jgi:spermidine/putrescine-binding protein